MGTSRRSSRSTKSFQWGSFWALPDGAVQAQSLCKWGFRELPRASGQLPRALRSFWARPGGAVQAQSLCNCGASGPSPVEQYSLLLKCGAICWVGEMGSLVDSSVVALGRCGAVRSRTDWPTCSGSARLGARRGKQSAQQNGFSRWLYFLVPSPWVAWPPRVLL